MPFNIDGHGTFCNESAYADDYVALYNGQTTDNPLAPDSRNDQLSPFHCGLYDEDPDFKLPGFKSTESSGKGVRPGISGQHRKGSADSWQSLGTISFIEQR